MFSLISFYCDASITIIIINFINIYIRCIKTIRRRCVLDNYSTITNCTITITTTIIIIITITITIIIKIVIVVEID
jgi:hypothetical protein